MRSQNGVTPGGGWRDGAGRDARHRPPSLILTHARTVVLLTAVIGLALTLLLNAAPAFEPEYQNRSLHVAKETTAALVLLLVAALLFGRFRRGGRLLDLLALAGVVVLMVKNMVFSVLTAILAETSGGLTTWRTTGTGMVGAALLVAAAFAPERIVIDRRRALVLAFGGCACALAALVALGGFFDLPAAFSDQPETRQDLQRFDQDAALLAADAAAAVLFGIAGVAFTIRAEREGDEFQLWLGIGAVIGGIAYLNYTLVPSFFTDFLYVGDIFRALAVVAWGTGTIRVISEYQRGYTDAAVYDERRRVARDLHDGVAQELAFISSQMHWLADRDDDALVVGRIRDAVNRALDESRAAISALSSPVDEPLSLALTHTAEALAGRLDVALDLRLDEDVVVPPAWEVALPRILREAIANAARHGHARTITVSLRDRGGVYLCVADDGVGFDPTRPRNGSSFGLTSMRERVETLGGEFTVSSEPGRGTAIEVLLR